MATKNKNLSSTVLVVLSILDWFGKEGAYLDEVCDEYDRIGLKVDKRSICTYLHRVGKQDLLRTEKEKDGSGRTIYYINKSGKEELKWWRTVISA